MTVIVDLKGITSHSVGSQEREIGKVPSFWLSSELEKTMDLQKVLEEKIPNKISLEELFASRIRQHKQRPEEVEHATTRTTKERTTNKARSTRHQCDSDQGISIKATGCWSRQSAPVHAEIRQMMVRAVGGDQRKPQRAIAIHGAGQDQNSDTGRNDLMSTQVHNFLFLHV